MYIKVKCSGNYNKNSLKMNEVGRRMDRTVSITRDGKSNFSRTTAWDRNGLKKKVSNSEEGVP